MIDSKLFDTSVWIAYFFEEKCIDEIEKSDHPFVSCLTLFEIKNKLLKRKINKEEINSTLSYIKEKSIILPLTKEIAEGAADIAFEKNIPAMDSLIYLTAIANKSILITLDNDFRNLAKTIILDKD